MDYTTGTDTITISDNDILASIDDDTITLSDWDSPLSTSLTNSYTFPSATLGTASAISNGAVGATLSTTTTGGGMLWNGTITSASPTVYTNQTTGWTTYNQPQVLKVTGDAEFEGDIKIKGVNLTERLDAIEERLGILRPNNDLEGKWEKLKALGEEYRKLEQEILEGEKIWATLKK